MCRSDPTNNQPPRWLGRQDGGLRVPRAGKARCCGHVRRHLRPRAEGPRRPPAAGLSGDNTGSSTTDFTGLECPGPTKKRTGGSSRPWGWRDPRAWWLGQEASRAAAAALLALASAGQEIELLRHNHGDLEEKYEELKCQLYGAAKGRPRRRRGVLRELNWASPYVAAGGGVVRRHGGAGGAVTLSRPEEAAAQDWCR